MLRLYNIGIFFYIIDKKIVLEYMVENILDVGELVSL